MKSHNIFRWDLDKTYLKTPLETLFGLLSTIFKEAEERVKIPGAECLIEETLEDPSNEVFFHSRNWEGMKRVLGKKLRTERIRYSRIYSGGPFPSLFKVRAGSWGDGIGLKLLAMLKERLYAEEGSVEFLFGDDGERDAFIYSLYADVVSGRTKLSAIEATLRLDKCPSELIEEILKTADKVKKGDTVERIFIQIERKVPQERFEIFGKRLVPFHNYFQPAVILFLHGIFSIQSVARVSTDLILLHGYAPGTLLESLQDMVRRGYISLNESRKFVEEMENLWKREKTYLPEAFGKKIEILSREIEDVKIVSPFTDRAVIDYPTLYVEFTKGE